MPPVGHDDDGRCNAWAAFTTQAKQLRRGGKSGGSGQGKEGWVAVKGLWKTDKLSRFLRVCQKSAKSEKPQEVYVLREVAKLLRRFDIKMVGAWGLEPQTSAVSRQRSTN